MLGLKSNHDSKMGPTSGGIQISTDPYVRLYHIVQEYDQELNGDLRTHMMTSSNGNIFRATGHLCGEFTGHR